VGEYFETNADVPFMQQVFRIRPEKRSSIPAVAHVDGTGRLQTVTEPQNSIYFRLIREFGERTGIPMVLNTSFNENEPIVNRPEEALDCFLRTKMDILVLGRTMVERG
jgi:carbamoyltransferase